MGGEPSPDGAWNQDGLCRHHQQKAAGGCGRLSGEPQVDVRLRQDDAEPGSPVNHYCCIAAMISPLTCPYVDSPRPAAILFAPHKSSTARNSAPGRRQKPAGTPTDKPSVGIKEAP